MPAHAELAWIFNCVARLGWMDRMTQFKEKSGKHKERASVGLYTYPVLMAADILVYKATHVPVGEDQKQHLELARDIAQKFNNDFDAPDFFPLPEPVITGPGTRVMSLRDGAKKMSKSDESDYSRINLTDDADAIAQKIRKAKTDPAPLPESEKGLEGRPEAENLFNIYAALADEPRAQVIAQFAGQQFSGFKNALADLAVAKLDAHRGRDAPAAGRSGRNRPDPGQRGRTRRRHRRADPGGRQAAGWIFAVANLPHKIVSPPPCGEVEMLEHGESISGGGIGNTGPPPGSLRSPTSPRGGGEELAFWGKLPP